MSTTLPKADAIQAEKRIKAIECATELFWRDGYDGASIEDVVKATGINRYALYQAFGDKKGLFIASLEHYHCNEKQQALVAISKPGAKTLDAMITFFEFKIRHHPECTQGCLLVSTAVEQAGQDPEINNRVRVYMSEMKGMMEASVSRAQAEGDIPAHLNPASVAEIIFQIFLGTSVQARLGISPETIIAGVRASFECLRAPQK